MRSNGSTRSLLLGSGLIRPDGLMAVARRFSALQRRLQVMDDMSRFQYAMLASIVVHAVVLFGISIRPPEPSKQGLNAPPLEVVLVNAHSTSRPLEADALAQQNLDGGGNTEAARRARSPLPVARDERLTRELSAESLRIAQLEREAQQLLTQVKSPTVVESAPPQPQVPAETRPALPGAAEIMSRSKQIARLEAQIDKDMDSYQRRARRKFIGARTQEYRFAAYIEDWRQKVERVGTLNYPQAARDQKIYGSLQLTVSIRSDGTVENVEINRSSGQKILDEAALRIVRLGAPYAAFPPDIAKDTDVLSITRTWTFTRSDQFSPE